MENDAELAQSVGESLRLYSVQVLNGTVAAFRPLLASATAYLQVYDMNGKVVVREAFMPNVQEYIAQVRSLKRKVKSLNEENKALSIVLEDKDKKIVELESAKPVIVEEVAEVTESED